MWKNKKRMRIATIFLFFLLSIYYGYREMLKQDWNHLCAAFEAKNLETLSFYTSRMEQIHKNIMTYPAEQRYPFYIEASRNIGYNHWKCPAIKEYFSSENL